MELNLNPHVSAAAASGIASAGGAARGAKAEPGRNAVDAFAGSLATALTAVNTSVQEARTQLSSAPSMADSNALQSTFNNLSALLGQFSDLLQSSGVKPPVGGGATTALAAAPVTNKPVTGLAAPSLSSGADALRGALFGPASAPTVGPSAAGQNTARAFASEVQTAKSGYPAGSPGHTYLSGLGANNPTEKWVTSALNKAIEQSRTNGYDPEKSHTVNTLRGYFSGDAQARSSAIHSLDSTMLEEGGAYETFDYGVHTIAGAPPEGMDTTMPSFKTAYDKDWNRPSLYDMINSSFGWPGEVPGSNAQPVNFADPANRDAALNRKLSDAEISAFQTGQLPAELQMQVQKYRGATM